MKYAKRRYVHITLNISALIHSMTSSDEQPICFKISVRNNQGKITIHIKLWKITNKYQVLFRGESHE